MPSHRRILIVDDSDLMRRLLRLSLSTRVDLKFDEAENGLIAIPLLGQHRYDLIFADIHMPLMNGLAFLRHIREDRWHANTPVVIISSETEGRDLDRIRQLGIQGYLTKPISGEDVRSILDTIFIPE
jgi:two-component system, chemotaxis family, chemotaxis protein CheY